MVDARDLKSLGLFARAGSSPAPGTIMRKEDTKGVAGATVEDDLDMRRFEDEYLSASVASEALGTSDV